MTASERPTASRDIAETDELLLRAAAAQAEARVTRDLSAQTRSQAELLREVSHLQNAIVSRDVIGQAKGILMERFNLDADQAFKLLRRRSQHLNVKLSEIADHLVKTRDLL